MSTFKSLKRALNVLDVSTRRTLTQTSREYRAALDIFFNAVDMDLLRRIRDDDGGFLTQYKVQLQAVHELRKLFNTGTGE